MMPRPKKLQLLRLLPNALVATSGGRDGRTLYLTFDDGPHPEHSAPLLDLLARHDAKATFFLIGDFIPGNEALVRRMVDEGHVLGNHSCSHPRFATLSFAEQLVEVERTDLLLREFDGRDRHVFRPPYGSMPLKMLLNFLRKGIRLAYWSYDSLDYTRRPWEELVDLLRSQPPVNGDIILMHDDDATSRHMLGVLLPEWAQQGLCFDTLHVPSPAGAGVGATP